MLWLWIKITLVQGFPRIDYLGCKRVWNGGNAKKLQKYWNVFSFIYYFYYRWKDCLHFVVCVVFTCAMRDGGMVLTCVMYCAVIFFGSNHRIWESWDPWHPHTTSTRIEILCPCVRVYCHTHTHTNFEGRRGRVPFPGFDTITLHQWGGCLEFSVFPREVRLFYRVSYQERCERAASSLWPLWM